MPPSKVKVNENLVEQLCSIADVDSTIAKHLLEACDNNLEMAINMHIEADSSVSITDNRAGSGVQACSSHMVEDEVRAPIPQKREVLVEAPDVLSFSFRRKHIPVRSVFDKLRDFEAETRRQEESLLNEENVPCSSNSVKQNKKKTLEDLFRPPLDLMFRDSFQGARDYGVLSKKWLLVNVQKSSEFACQVLNRDVWSNPSVKEIVNEHFIFWQIYHDSEEGSRYMNFYPVNEWPYIAIIDPRTGECMISWKKIDAASFRDTIGEFLAMHMSLADSLSSSPPKKKRTKSDQNNILEADETAQIEAAIKASLAETMQNVDEDSDDSLDIIDEIKFSSTNKVSAVAPNVGGSIDEEDDWRKYLGEESDPVSRLVLRLPDGSRDSVQMPSTSSLKALILYVTSKGFPNETYELVTNFPRRQLSSMDFGASLKASGLFPQETVFVQKR